VVHLARPRSFSALTSVVILFLAALLAIPQAAARESAKEKPYALIFGTVWGPDNQVLYGVKIKIRRSDQKKAHWELYSDHRGEFAQRVPAGKGDYVVWADTKDYKLSSGKRFRPGAEVTVHIENDERSDIGVHLTY
jgi:hypothetical protein